MNTTATTNASTSEQPAKCVGMADLVGKETWGCAGYDLTPELREQIAQYVFGMYEWAFGWEWPESLITVDDFLQLETGKTHPNGYRLIYVDEYTDWLESQLEPWWGIDTGRCDDVECSGENGVDCNSSDEDVCVPLDAALDRLDAWFEMLKLDDLVVACRPQVD